MPKEPRRVPTVLGRVQNGPVARPSGSVVFVASLQTAIEQRPLLSSLAPVARRLGARVGLSAESRILPLRSNSNKHSAVSIQPPAKEIEPQRARRSLRHAVVPVKPPADHRTYQIDFRLFA